MKLITSSSPHIRSGETTRRLMGTVLLALLPTLAAGVWFFALRALLLTLVSVASCVASEWAFRAVTKSPGSIADGSAAVTGLLLALTLPATAPYWLAAVGGVFAIVVVKGLSGGLGQNIFNPALAARAFLMLLWPAWLVRYAPAGAELPLFGSTADVVSAATPLHDMVMPALPAASPADMLLGNIGGCIGEVSALALLIGGAILLGRKVISWRIPAAYLGTVAFLTLVFYKGEDPVAWMLYSLLGGGVMLGALFMATDYATSPALPAAQLVYGVGCGALTVLFRYFGLYPEGVTYAILLMNANTAYNTVGLFKGTSEYAYSLADGAARFMGKEIHISEYCADNEIYIIDPAQLYVRFAMQPVVEGDKSVGFMSAANTMRCLTVVDFAWNTAAAVRVGVAG